MKDLLNDPNFRKWALIGAAVLAAFVLFAFAIQPDAINDIRDVR